MIFTPARLNRQGERKRRTLPHVAFHLNVAAMRFDEMPDNRQPKAETGHQPVAAGEITRAWLPAERHLVHGIAGRVRRPAVRVQRQRRADGVRDRPGRVRGRDHSWQEPRLCGTREIGDRCRDGGCSRCFADDDERERRHGRHGRRHQPADARTCRVRFSSARGVLLEVRNRRFDDREIDPPRVPGIAGDERMVAYHVDHPRDAARVRDDAVDGPRGEDVRISRSGHA